MIGKKKLGEQFSAKANRLKKVFRDTFWMEKEGLFADAVYGKKVSEVRSQVSNVFAIWAGIVDGDKARAIISKITDEKNLLPRTEGDYRLMKDFKCQTGGIVQIGTPALGFLLAYQMFKAGLDKQAIRYLKDNWPPLWQNGTFAEHFAESANTSYCHGWSAGPVILLPRFILGVKPLSPGWETIEVNPHPGNLKWAKGTVPTPHGDIKIEWKKTGEGVDVNIKTPAKIKIIKTKKAEQ